MEEIEQKARDLGWSPKEEFRGDEAKWIDAEEFVRRGEELMPILKANNRKLHTEVSELRGALTETQKLLQGATESIEALKEFRNSETLKVAKAERSKIVDAIKEARSEGDVEQEESLREKLNETTEAIRTAEKEPEAKPTPKPADPTMEAAFNEWKKDNAWFGGASEEDSFKTDLAVTMGRRMRVDPAYKDLTGKAFLDKVGQEVEKHLRPRSNGEGKVAEGGRSTGGGNESDGKSFADLPPDAKAQFAKDVRRLVGPGRAFKDEAAYRQFYLNEYFS